MNHSFFFIFYGTLTVLTVFVVAKVFTLDWKIRLKESIYFILCSIVVGILRRYTVVDYVGAESDVVRFVFDIIYNVLVFGLFFFYFYKLKSYSAKKAVILLVFVVLFFSNLIGITTITIANFLAPILFPDQAAAAPSGYEIILLHPVKLGLRLFLNVLFSIPLSFLTVKLTKKLRKAISDSNRLQTVLSAIFIFVFAIGAVLWILSSYEGQLTATTVFSPNMLLIYGSATAMLVSFFFYARFLKAKFNLQQKEAEQRSLLFYVDEIEQQQSAIRKFKHDQQNLFSILDIYVQEKDWDGLTQFYPKVRAASEIITKNEFDLEGLANIKVQEVKSIITAKLAMAQHLGLTAKFEAGEEIDDIPVDSVTLVRMLGIIMDNAIEEVQSLGTGQLFAGCFKVEGSIHFVVQNTCRPDMPPLRQLRQSGYSTKGEGRGLGLSNLYELTDSLPNVALQTGIENGHFTQTLIIGGAV